MSTETTFNVRVKTMISGLRGKIQSSVLPDDVTKIQQEKNQFAKQAQLELLEVIIKGIDNIEANY